MKSSYIKSSLVRLAVTTVAAWLGGGALPTRADSPVGNWDFHFAGDQQGVAQINFYLDFTVDGIEISSPGKLTKKPSTNSRGPADDRDDPRSPADPASPAYEYIYGTSVISGSWGYDPKGRIIGSLILTSANVTNGWSFTGVAKLGTKPRMTMTTHHNTSIGLRSVFRGVQRGAPLPSITGTGGFAESGTMVNRINLTTQGYSRIMRMGPGGAPNIFSVTEAGPGYDGSGFAIITRNNYIGIYTDHFAPGTTNTVIVTASGPFNPTKMSARLKGFAEGKYSIYSKLWSFDAP